MNTTTHNMDTLFYQCISQAVNDVDNIPGLEALIAVLTRIDDSIGLVTDRATYDSTMDKIDKKIE